MEQNTINQRLNLVVDTFEGGKKAAFARKVGMSTQGVQEILAGRKGDPSFKVLVRILESYPQVGADWLVRGLGPMLQEEVGVLRDPENEYIGYIGQYPILSGKDNIAVPIVSGFYNRAEWDNPRRNPAHSSDEIEKNLSFEILSLPKSMLKEGRHIILPVYDNTMEPTFIMGDLLLFRHVEKPKWGAEPEKFPAPSSFLDNIPVYAVESCVTDERYVDITIGRFTFDDETGMVRCYPDNRSYATPSIEVTVVKDVWEFQLLISSRSGKAALKQQEAINQLQGDLQRANQVITNLLAQLPAKEVHQESEASPSLEKPLNIGGTHLPAKRVKSARK